MAVGVFVGAGHAKGVTAFGEWRGRPVDLVHAFAASDTWVTIELPDWWLGYYRDSAYASSLLVSLPMLPVDPDDEEEATLQEGAEGDYDEHFETAARRLVAAGMGGAVVRPGWELNGATLPWYAGGDPRAYREYFSRIVRAMRSVPGAGFTFEWNVANGASPFEILDAYPGDDVVDVVGVDVYNSLYGRPACRGADRSDCMTPAERWEELVEPASSESGRPTGLAFWAAFAEEHGKPLGFSEWGLWDIASDSQAGGGGGDDPEFVRRMHTWFSTHDVAYEAYFQVDAPDGKHDLERFPEAAREYRRLFGR